jgi:hypothetical protein
MARYLLEAPDGDLLLWKRLAAADERSLAAWLRSAAREKAGRAGVAGGGFTPPLGMTESLPSPLEPLKTRPQQPDAASGEADDAASGAKPGQSRVLGRGSPPEVSALESAAVEPRTQAERLARRGGRCTADTPRGTKCKLCLRVH